MFALPPPGDPLTQGDLFDDCPLVGFSLASMPLDLDDPPTKWWTTRVIVLTQSCDLSQGKTDTVLVAPVHDAQKLVDAGVLKNALIRDHVRRHLVFGWYFLPEATAPVQLAEALIDLRDVQSIPRAVLEQLITGGKRIASLTAPFREHLAQHFAVTYMRVALPEPYATKP
jgi:hypothetical protein